MMRRMILIAIGLLLSLLASVPADYQLSVTSPLTRVFRDEVWTGPPAKYLHLAAAANEYESLQLVFDGSLQDVRVTCTDLINQTGDRIAATNIRARSVGYVTIDAWKSGDDIYFRGGEYPDVLLNKATFDVDGLQPVWLTVYVPPATPPGHYNGAVTIRSQDVARQLIPLTVTVWDFELPVQQHLPTSFNMRPNTIVGFFYNLSPPDGPGNWPDFMPAEVYRRWISFLLDYRITPHLYDEQVEYDEDDKPTRLSYYSRVPYLDAEWQDGNLVLDWTEVDRNLELLFKRGAAIANVGYAPAHANTEYRRFWQQYLAQAEAHFAEKGWLDKCYIYGPDEPHARGNLDEVILWMKLLGEWGPNLKRLQTTQHFPPKADFRGCVDIWVPLIGAWNAATAHEYKDRGEDVWVYTGCGGLSRPNFHFQEPAIRHRLLPWVLWQHDIDGLLYYCTVNWPWYKLSVDDINADGSLNESWDSPSGGYLVYPGGKSIMDAPQASVRLENLRDGLEDYEYLYMLRNLGGQLPTLGSSDVNTPQVDPLVIDTERRAMAEQIQRLTRIK